MPEEKSFGILIKRAIEQKKWTQDELAAEVGVSRGTINRWIQDVQRPAVHYLKKLTDTLELDETEAYTLYYAGGKTPPERHNLPLPNRFFTGREAYLKELRKLLEKHRIVALHGLAGIGKTQIALAYAHRFYPDVYPTALWVNAADTAILDADFASLAETLRLPEKDEQELEPRIKAVRTWLEEHTKWLLVMDNADELPIVKPFLLSKPRGYIVLTTRWQFPGEFARPLPVEAMETNEGVRFLWRRARPVQDEAEIDVDAAPPDIHKPIRQLVQELGGHAIALEQAGAYIQQTGTSFADYLEMYEENRRSLLSQYGALKDEHNKHRLTVAATFKGSLARARDLSSLAEDILHFCTFLQPDAIPEELFQYDESFKQDTMAFKGGMEALLRYSLMKLNTQEQTFSLHRLVQAVLIDDMASDLQKQWRKGVVQVLMAAFAEGDFDKEWERCERLLPHVFTCAAWAQPELDSLRGASLLFLQASLYLYVRGRFSEAEQLCIRALSILENLPGTDDSFANMGRGLLSYLYTRLGKNELAEPLRQRVFASIEKDLGTIDVEDVDSITGWTQIYISQGKYEDAEGLLLQALSIKEQQFDAEYSILTQLEAVYMLQGKIEQVEPLSQQVIAISEKHFGPIHPITARALPMLAVVYHAQGKYEQAELLYRRALSIWDDHLKVEHPDITIPLLGLARLLQDQGKREQAEAMYQRTLRIQEQQIGTSNPDTQATRREYVDFLHSIGRDTEAAALEANDEPPV